MKYDNNRPIYIQIIENIFDMILQKKWLEETRIPSIRELALIFEVNPNTVAKAYNECVDLGIIYNKRGIGYFLCKNAYDKILEIKKKDFLQNELPYIVKKIAILNISLEQFISCLKSNYESFISNSYITKE